MADDTRCTSCGRTCCIGAGCAYHIITHACSITANSANAGYILTPFTTHHRQTA
jgi:hypothetical protein